MLQSELSRTSPMEFPARLCSFVYVSYLLLFSSASSSIAATSVYCNDKVSLELYYESLCPYCANFIVNYLVHLFDDDLISIVDLRLVPYGNARVGRNGSITCQVLRLILHHFCFDLSFKRNSIFRFFPARLCLSFKLILRIWLWRNLRLKSAAICISFAFLTEFHTLLLNAYNAKSISYFHLNYSSSGFWLVKTQFEPISGRCDMILY